MDLAINIQNNSTYEIRSKLIDLINTIDSECDSEIKEDTLHSIRKATKKIRALLLLIRNDFGYSNYIREKNVFQGISKELAAYRNVEVFHSMAVSIDKMFYNELTYSCLAASIHHLGCKKEQNKSLINVNSEIIVSVKERLRSAMYGFESTRLSNITLTTLIRGLIRTYKKCRQAFLFYTENQSDYYLHEMRKLLRFLGYQIRTLMEINPIICKAHEKSISEVIKILGEMNDYIEFRNFYNQIKFPGLNKTNKYILDTMINQLLDEKRRVVLPMVKLVLVEKPEAMAGRFVNYLKVREQSVLVN